MIIRDKILAARVLLITAGFCALLLWELGSDLIIFMWISFLLMDSSWLFCRCTCGVMDLSIGKGLNL